MGVVIRLARKQLGHVAPDHQRDQPIPVDLADLIAGHVLPVFQHRHPVADLEDLLQPVGNIDDGHAIGLQRLKPLEQKLDLVARDHRRRLVQDQQLDLVHHRLGDLDHLLIRHGQFRNQLVRVDIDAQAVQQFARILAGLAIVDQAERAPPLVPEKDVLGDTQMRKQNEFLIDDVDSGRLRLARRRPMHDLVVELDLASVGLIDARNHLGQRRFSGAVLAHQSVDFTGVNLEINAVERANPGKRF